MTTIEKVGARVYLVSLPFAAKDKAKEAGCKWDPDRRQWWSGVAKQAALEALVAELNSAPAGAANGTPAKQCPHDIRLTGKGTYKGRSYYLGSRTRDGARMRLLTLPDDKGSFLDFWADATQVEVVKTYHPRERIYRGHATTSYTTLGSIADFVADQKNPATRRGECCECGAWGHSGESCSECGGEGSYG